MSGRATTGAKPATRGRPRAGWAPAIVAALGVHAAAFALLAIAPLESAPRETRAYVAVWVGDRPDAADRVVADQLALKDPTPLFLPTRWNFGSQRRIENDDRRPGDIFPTDGPRLAMAEKAGLPGLVTIPTGAVLAGEVLRQFPRPYHLAFGQMDREVTPVPPRLAVVELRAITGERLQQSVVPVDAAAAEGWPPWHPFEVLVVVTPTGSLGTPLVTGTPTGSLGAASASSPGSGAEVVDEFFRAYVRSGMRLDLRVPAGYYRVLIRP